jgi:hypothetical protein
MKSLSAAFQNIYNRQPKFGTEKMEHIWKGDINHHLLKLLSVRIYFYPANITIKSASLQRHEAGPALHITPQ